MNIFYNEWDSYAAQWLRNLSNDGHIPKGIVCEKSITDLTKNDLDGYDQCHFFTGIGGWLLALRWAGLEGISGVWTGSPPCQPFSIAGKKLGVKDERHLAPTWIELIKAKKPPIIFGEQVASAIAHGWIDELFYLLEKEGYACGFAVLSGYVVGAPHKRERIFFGAVKMADASKMYGTWKQCWEPRQRQRDEQEEFQTRSSDIGGLPSQWRNYEIHTSEYDSKNRIRKPGIPLLVNGVPGTLGGISGYGNAIVPQVACFFIEQFMESIGDMLRE